MKLLATLCLLGSLGSLVGACTATRILAAPDALRLRTPDQHPFIAATTERWHERVDPNTQVRFQNGSGAWSAPVYGRDLFINAAGAWTDYQVGDNSMVDGLRISGMSPADVEQLAATAPELGKVERIGRLWYLSAPPAEITAWMQRIEVAIARQEVLRHAPNCLIDDCVDTATASDELLLRTLHTAYGNAPLGQWALHSSTAGWQPPVTGAALEGMLQWGRAGRRGWLWSDIKAVSVENIHGGRTLGALVGISAVAVALAPAALLLSGGGLSVGEGHGGGGGGGGGGTGAALAGAIGGGGGSGLAATYTPIELDEAASAAQPLFSYGTRARSIALPTLSLDTTLAGHGDLVSTVASARVRFVGIVELGGGVGSSETHDAMGWHHSTTGNFQIGLHLPIDAGGRIAVPLGFQVGGGGDVGLDLRLPWGLRYTSASGRWFATAQPATPTYSRTRGEMARWSLAAGAEVGVTF